MKSIATLLKNELKIPTKSPIVLSVSGGMDSMALLSIMKDTPYKIAVVHFNHLKRDESVIEKDLVESYCREHEIPFHYYTIKVSEGNFHHQAHHLRNHYLNQVADLYKTPYIMTAHHLDDLFENVLIKLTRGSNLLGYAGMQMVHDDHHHTYLKPFLYIPKKDIRDYVIKHSIPYLDDASNDQHMYLRNRYRHAVVPVMKQENDNLLEQIKQYHLQLTQAFQMIRTQSLAYLDNQPHISLKSYSSITESIKDDLIAILIEKHKLDLSYEIIQKIKKMLMSNKPNQTYKLSKNYIFVKAYDKAFIQEASDKSQLRIKLKEGENRLSNVAKFTFLSKTTLINDEMTKLCYNELAFPLWLRHREEGDVLAYDYGHKKLKKLLIDQKIPMSERDQLWVLTDNENTILWVQNHYLNKTLGNEKALYFKLNEGNKHA